MGKLYTSEQIYASIESVIDKRKGCDRSLEHYLLALKLQLEVVKKQNGLSIREFLLCLENAFEGRFAPFEDDWRLYDKQQDKRIKSCR